jgi:hypothetical protein
MSIISYSEFLAAKQIRFAGQGVAVDDEEMCDRLYPFQRSLVVWALAKGRSCLFADCGLLRSGSRESPLSRGGEESDGSVLVMAPRSDDHG